MQWWQVEVNGMRSLAAVCMAIALLTSVSAGRAASEDGGTAEDRSAKAEAPARDGAAPENSGADGAADADDANTTSGDEPAALPTQDPKQLRRILQVLADIDEALAEQIRQLQESDPDLAWKLLEPHFGEVGRLADLREQDETGYELRVQDIVLAHRSQELTEQILEAKSRGDGETMRAAELTLRQVVARHFEVRQQLRQHELALYEQRLQRMREAVAEREEKRDRIIEARMEELVGEKLPGF